MLNKETCRQCKISIFGTMYMDRRFDYYWNQRGEVYCPLRSGVGTTSIETLPPKGCKHLMENAVAEAAGKDKLIRFGRWCLRKFCTTVFKGPIKGISNYDA
jgi:hypothetical protein